LKKNLYLWLTFGKTPHRQPMKSMPLRKNKSVFIGVCGIPAPVALLLRQRARANNRSVSGEVRNLIELTLSGAVTTEPTNTEQNKTQTWTSSQS